MFSFRRSSSKPFKGSKKQLLDFINSILSIKLPDLKFSRFMTECKSRISSNNNGDNSDLSEDNLSEMLKDLICENKIESNYPFLIWLIRENPLKYEPIILQLLQNHSHILSSFLNETDINLNNENLLMWSVKQNCINLSLYLLSSHRQDLDINAVNSINQSIITLAIVSDKHKDMISKLVTTYPDLNISAPNQYPFQNSAITYSLWKDLEQDLVLKILLHSSVIKAGVSYLNQKDEDGYTALHWSCQHGYLRVLKHLLSVAGIQTNVRNSSKYTPAMLSVGSTKGSALAMLLDHSSATAKSVKQEIKSMDFSFLFFIDFFKHIRKINPSKETMSWFMNHPSLDFQDWTIVFEYIANVPPPFDLEWMAKFQCSQLYLEQYPLNPNADLPSLEFLIPFDSKNRISLWTALGNAISSPSCKSVEIIQWLTHELGGHVELDSESAEEVDKLGMVLSNLIHGTGIVDSFLHPLAAPVPSLKEIVAHKVLEASIPYNSQTLVVDLIELLEDPRSWVKQGSLHSHGFTFVGDWRRASEEIDARLSALIQGFGGVEVTRKLLMNNNDVLKSILGAYGSKKSSLQLPLALNFLIHRYKVIELEKVEALIGRRKLRDYVNDLFQYSPYLAMIVDIFGPSCWLADDDIDILRLLERISLNVHLSDEQSVIVLEKLLALKSAPAELSKTIIDRLCKTYTTTSAQHFVPYRTQFFNKLTH